MSKDIKTFLQYSWIAASVACFILPLLLIPPDNLGHWPGDMAGDMSLGMFILAFPVGLLYLIMLALIFYVLSPPVHDLPVSFYVLLWFGFFVTGYLQWFHLFPYFLNRKKSLTTLGLSNIEVEKVERKRRRRPRARKRKASQEKIESKPVLQFEQPRRTPLEKVISEN